MDLSEALLSLATALVGVIAFYVRAWLQAKVAPDRLAHAGALARAVVSAAEQLGSDLGIKGPEKYEYAERALVVMAKRVGLRLKSEEANVLIHAVLAEMEPYFPGTNDQAVAA